MKKSKFVIPAEFEGPHPEREDVQIVKFRASYLAAVRADKPVCVFRQPDELKPGPELEAFLKTKGNTLPNTKSHIAVDDGKVRWMKRHERIPEVLVPHIETQALLFHEATGTDRMLSEFPDAFLSWNRGMHKDGSTGQLYVYKGIDGTTIPLGSKKFFNAAVRDVTYVKIEEPHATPNFWNRVVHALSPLGYDNS